METWKEQIARSQYLKEFKKRDKMFHNPNLKAVKNSYGSEAYRKGFELYLKQKKKKQKEPGKPNKSIPYEEVDLSMITEKDILL